MPINKRQHFVSQSTIRQFLGGRKLLFCLDKKLGQVRDRLHGNAPGDILNESYYYTTDTDDFDGEVVRPIEDQVSPLIRDLADGKDCSEKSDAWASAVNWCALSLTRSIYVAQVAPLVVESMPEEERNQLPPDRKAMTLLTRRATFERMREEMRKVHVTFRVLRAPQPFSYYLTDYPPAPVPIAAFRVGMMDPMLLPLSHEAMLVMAPLAVAIRFFKEMKPTLLWTTLMQCGWANRLIYSADLDSLDFAAWVLRLRSTGPDKEMWLRAQEPFFGLSERSELEAIWKNFA